MFDLSFKNFVRVGEFVHLFIDLCHLIFMQFAEWDGFGDAIDDSLGVVFVFAEVRELCDFHDVLCGGEDGSASYCTQGCAVLKSSVSVGVVLEVALFTLLLEPLV